VECNQLVKDGVKRWDPVKKVIRTPVGSATYDKSSGQLSAFLRRTKLHGFQAKVSMNVK
jgi:hypothetical protein